MLCWIWTCSPNTAANKKIWCKWGQILHYFLLNFLLAYGQRHVLYRFTGSCFVAFGRAARQVVHDNTPAMWISQHIYSGGRSCALSFLLIAWEQGHSYAFREEEKKANPEDLFTSYKGRPFLHIHAWPKAFGELIWIEKGGWREREKWCQKHWNQMRISPRVVIP